MNLRRYVCVTLALALALPAQALVQIFGDSLLADNTPVQAHLAALAPNATLENFARIGAGMRDGWVEAIPAIYEANRRRPPLPPATTIVLDGGGNDVNSVRQDCVGGPGESLTQACADTLDAVAALVHGLVRQMREDGTKHVLYMGFFYLKGFEAAVDYGNERVLDFCQPSNHCFFVDLRNVTVSVGWDGMHPTPESYHDIAQAIWDTKLRYDVPFA